MPTQIYLDTARLGRMTPRARAAHSDFNAFAADEGGSPHVDHLLQKGFGGWPQRLQSQYGGLSDWEGIPKLKWRLRKICGAPGRFGEPAVRLANRASQLLKVGVRGLFERCRNVLVTDLDWPAYRSILEREAECQAREITQVALRDFVLRERAIDAHVIHRIRSVYRDHRCDGLFLPAVSNLGIRLPIRALLHYCAMDRGVKFAAIDGAQELGHVGTLGTSAHCDFYLAGCHKWLGAYHPLGMACYASTDTRPMLVELQHEMMQNGELDDPLLEFSEQLETGTTHGFGETVSLSALFSSNGAVLDATTWAECRGEDFDQRVENADVLAEALTETTWSPLRPHRSLRSGILLLESTDSQVQNQSPDPLREHFLDRGIALTTYPGGMLRLSMPQQPWKSEELDLVRTAFTGS